MGRRNRNQVCGIAECILLRVFDDVIYFMNELRFGQCSHMLSPTRIPAELLNSWTTKRAKDDLFFAR